MSLARDAQKISRTGIHFSLKLAQVSLPLGKFRYALVNRLGRSTAYFCYYNGQMKYSAKVRRRLSKQSTSHRLENQSLAPDPSKTRTSQFSTAVMLLFIKA